MHSALLIDEVFEVILEHCSDWHRHEYRWTLSQLARTCKALKDPSLDRLWRRLESEKPLFNLYGSSKCSVDTSIVDACSYESRIKHLKVLKTPTHPHPNSVLPNLQSVHLHRGGCFVPASVIATRTLRDLQVDLGPVVHTTAAESRSTSLAETLEHLSLSGTRLEKLRIRGWMSPLLCDTLSSLRSLQSLVLMTGTSLTANTFASFTSFPNLKHLSVHAEHIDAADLVAALPSGASFASLRNLRIRASHSLICAILAIIPRDTLHAIYIQTKDFDQDPLAWKPTFELLTLGSANTLTDFTIDQLQGIDDIGDANFLSHRSRQFPLDVLRPLHALTALQRFTLDTIFPPDLTDSDMDQIASWWPHLQKLDLGTLSGCPGTDAQFTPAKMTLACLPSLAKHCRDLRTLVLPLNLRTSDLSSPLNKVAEETIPAQTALQTLLIGGLPPPDMDTPTLIRQILTIFPRLEEIESTTVNRSLLGGLETSDKDSMDTETVLMDEFANGQ